MWCYILIGDTASLCFLVIRLLLRIVSIVYYSVAVVVAIFMHMRSAVDSDVLCSFFAA